MTQNEKLYKLRLYLHQEVDTYIDSINDKDFTDIEGEYVVNDEGDINNAQALELFSIHLSNLSTYF